MDAVDLKEPEDWTSGDQALLTTITEYWDAYLQAAAVVVSELPPELVAELPKYLTTPQQILVTVASDGVVIVHVDAEAWSIARRVSPMLLDEIVLEATGIFEPPIGADADIALIQPVIEVVDVEAGAVIARKEGARRIEVVSHREGWRWEPRWAPAVMRSHVFVDAYQVATGKYVPFLSAASRALEAAAQDLEQLLDTEPKEERLHMFLARSPQLLSATYLTVLSKPRLGAEHVPDFAVEEAPGRWMLIEIERSTHSLFTKQGDPSAALTHAVRQITDWRGWVLENVPYARTTLRNVRETTGLVIIGRSVEGERDSLQRYVDGLGRIQILTWDDVVASARRHARNLRAQDATAVRDESWD